MNKYLRFLLCVILVISVTNCSKDTKDEPMLSPKNISVKDAYNRMRDNYDVYLDSLFFFPDNPLKATEADRAVFRDETFWPAKFAMPDLLTDNSVEAMRRTFNFLRYTVHTKAFAKGLRNVILVDRGRMIDYREVMEVLRNFNYTTTFQIDESKNSNALVSGLGDDIPENHIPIDATTIPTSFDPTFGSHPTWIKMFKNHITSIGEGSIGSARNKYNYGLSGGMIQLVFHEMLHNICYTHGLGTSEYIEDNLKGKFDDKLFKDVNYGVQDVFFRMYNSYFGLTPSLQNYTLDRVGIISIDSAGVEAGHTNFPMDFYKDPKGAEKNDFYMVVPNS